MGEQQLAMEKIVLITMGWLFVVGGAIVLGVLLEHTLHRRKSKWQDENFARVKFDSSERLEGLEEGEREFRRSG